MNAGASRLGFLAVLVLGLGLRLALLPLAESVPPVGDSIDYLKFARQWVETGEFGTLPLGMRPPIGRVLMGLGLDTSVEPAEAWPGVYLVQIAADLATLWLLMVLTRRLFGAGPALVTGVVYATLPQAIHYSALSVHVEPFNALMSTLGLLALAWIEARVPADEGAPRWLVPCLGMGVALGLVIGTGLLVKQAMLMAGLAMVGAIVLTLRVPWMRRATLVVAIASTAFLVDLPWRLHTEKLLGVALTSGTYGAFHVVAMNFPPDQQDYDRIWAELPDTQARLDYSSDVLRRAWTEYRDVTWSRVPRRLGLTIGPEIMYGTRLVRLLETADEFPWLFGQDPGSRFRDPDARSPREEMAAIRRMPLTSKAGFARFLAELLMLLFLSAGAAGLTSAGGSAQRRATLLMLLAMLASGVVIGGVARYRFLLAPFLAPFAGLAWVQLVQGKLSRRARVVGGVVLAIVGTTMFVLPRLAA